jgi:uncharacterized protein YkwD
MTHAVSPRAFARRLTMFACALAAASVALLPVTTARAGGGRRLDRADRAVIRYINAYRRGHGLGRLHVSGRMSIGAKEHSLAMAHSGVMAHGSWVNRVRRFARSRTIGEVVGWVHGGGAGAIVSAWMHSPPHRAVLLSGAYRRAGVGRCRHGGIAWYTVDVAR